MSPVEDRGSRRNKSSKKKSKKKVSSSSRASYDDDDDDDYYVEEEEEKREIQPPNEEEQMEIRPRRRRRHSSSRKKSSSKKHHSKKSAPPPPPPREENIFTRAIPAPPLSSSHEETLTNEDDDDDDDHHHHRKERHTGSQRSKDRNRARSESGRRGHRHRSESDRHEEEEDEKEEEDEEEEEHDSEVGSSEEDYFLEDDEDQVRQQRSSNKHQSRVYNGSNVEMSQQVHYEGMADDEEQDPGAKAEDLHHAMELSAWKSVFEMTIKDDPHEMHQVVEQFLDEKHCSFHKLLWKAPPALTKAILQHIIDHNENYLTTLLMMKDDDDNTPLHLYCANLYPLHKTNNKSELAVLKMLVKSNPRVLQRPNSQGDTPLHLFVSSKACTEGEGFSNEAAAEQVAAMLLEASVEAAILQDCSGATPLHVAIAHVAHERVLLTLLDLAPVAAKVKDDNGLIPLHYAAAVGLSMKYAPIQTLIEAYPEGLLLKTTNGDTPLHLLLSNLDLHDEGGERPNLDRESAKVVELLAGFASADDGEPELLLDRGSPVTTANEEKVRVCVCLCVCVCFLLNNAFSLRVLVDAPPLLCCL